MMHRQLPIIWIAKEVANNAKCYSLGFQTNRSQDLIQMDVTFYSTVRLLGLRQTTGECPLLVSLTWLPTATLLFPGGLPTCSDLAGPCLASARNQS